MFSISASSMARVGKNEQNTVRSGLLLKHVKPKTTISVGVNSSLGSEWSGICRATTGLIMLTSSESRIVTPFENFWVRVCCMNNAHWIIKIVLNINSKGVASMFCTNSFIKRSKNSC